ncbi:electron transport complex subunit RsxG [Marinospirillum perlucidum]|uniref:electron transport complex subunit RsxG n=1 Tax=Marinospirillum perlucidum TaxID=1982602 RepID=UPI000DF349A9|nr:electron transport complex subunit RsxG [Marinospirillum perlucidum]
MTQETNQPSLGRSLVRSVTGLLAFALVTAGAVALTKQLTSERIADNQAQAEARLLHELAPPEAGYRLNLDDPLMLPAAPELGHQEPFAAHLAFRDGRPELLLLPVVATGGYTGAIQLLVALKLDGKLQGVRVTRHQETPGLGDRIEEKKSDWIHSFAGASLGAPPLEDWQVKKDGGAFDQFTGATITPRAVVRGVRDSLLWHRDQWQQLSQKLPLPAAPTQEEDH